MRECETKIFFWGCGLNPSLYGMHHTVHVRSTAHTYIWQGWAGPLASRVGQTRPDLTRLDQTQPELLHLVPARLDQTRPDLTRLDQTQPELLHLMSARLDQTQPDSTRALASRVGQTRPDSTRLDQTRPDSTRLNQTRPNSTRLNQNPYTSCRPDSARLKPYIYAINDRILVGLASTVYRHRIFVYLITYYFRVGQNRI